jgi:hypothetical protein
VTPRLLHIFSTFNLGGAQMRAVQLMNAWGKAYHHSVVSVGRNELAARERLADAVTIDFPEFPDLKAGSLPARLWAIRKRLRQWLLGGRQCSARRLAMRSFRRRALQRPPERLPLEL